MKRFLLDIRLLAGVMLISISAVNAQVFLPDDPIWHDPDQLDVPVPQAAAHSEFYDFYKNTFRNPGKYNSGPAQNVNTLGEVPNSSWYENRHYRRPMSEAELMRGSNDSSGPSLEKKWLIIQGKSQGITPGFTIEDANGDRYLIKFDPPSNPEMTTGAEIICTRLFYALGYHVPENYLVRFSKDRLRLSADATTTNAAGTETPLTQSLVNRMLRIAYIDDEGYFRAIASKFLDGKPLGPFLYYGTVPDDANDIFPHESRRELRGLKVFAAWLNHDDARSVNSLDMLVTAEAGHQYVRHHLIDFGSTLGSGSVAPQGYRAGNEYILEVKPILRAFLSLGFWIRPWAKVEYPDYPSIGRIEGDFFDPENWKTEYPNPAFLNCDAEDAFWAAKQVMAFTDEQLRAVVSLAKYSNAQAAEYLLEVLRKRRDKIGDAYLRFSGGLDRFRIEEERQLAFDDLPAMHGLEESGAYRNITWHPFDNLADKIGDVFQESSSSSLQIPIPRSDSEFIVAHIETPGLGSVRVFLSNQPDSLKVVGIRRQ